MCFTFVHHKTLSYLFLVWPIQTNIFWYKIESLSSLALSVVEASISKQMGQKCFLSWMEFTICYESFKINSRKKYLVYFGQNPQISVVSFLEVGDDIFDFGGKEIQKISFVVGKPFLLVGLDVFQKSLSYSDRKFSWVSSVQKSSLRQSVTC